MRIIRLTPSTISQKIEHLVEIADMAELPKHKILTIANHDKEVTRYKAEKLSKMSESLLDRKVRFAVEHLTQYDKVQLPVENYEQKPNKYK